MKHPLIEIVSLTVLLCVVSTPARGDYFPFLLDARQVVPPAEGVEGGGSADLLLDCVEDALEGWVWVAVSETVTGVHIHGPADVGENAGILFELPLPVFAEIPVQLAGVGPYCEIFGRERCYIDVHTTAHPDGAIRGQFHHEVAVKPTPWSVVKQLYR